MATFKYLKNVAISHHPTFYYSYIQCPHPPYIFNPDGSKPQLAENDINVIKNPKGYINQIRFVGSQIIEIVKILKERDPNAVIIVQADHGAGWCFYDDLYISEPSNKNRNFIEIQYGVLSAISTPSGVAIPKNVTPVNLFRYLFNSLFNDQFKILPDKIYFTPIKEPYKFYNVTNIYNSVKRKN